MSHLLSMPYRFEPTGKLGRQAARIAREQLQLALEAVGQDSAAAAGPRIRCIRTCLKKIRSLLRFVEASAPNAFHKMERARLRKTAQHLAVLRDADVRICMFDSLGSVINTSECRSLRTALETGREKAFRNEAKTLKTVQPLLAAALADVSKWPLANFNENEAIRGIESVYKTARRAFKQATRHQDPETLHRWRGKIKAYWHALRLFENVPSRSLQNETRRANKLSDLLGTYHDLTNLGETLAAMDLKGHGRKTINKKLFRRCNALKKRALTLGAATFQTKPGALAKKLEPGIKHYFK
jgi:CHAD domain-containing protein